MIQGLAEHNLHPSEKQAFFDTLRILAGKRARLPESVVITDEIDYSASDRLRTSSGFADIRQGRYKGCAVAVKTLRVSMADDFEKFRRVSGKNVILAGRNTTKINS